MKTIYFLCTIFVQFYCSISLGRSIHRPSDPHIPSIMTHWKDDTSHCHYLQSPYLDSYPFFEIFDKEYFDKHALPTNPIKYRYNKAISIESAKLSELIDTLIYEVHQKKSAFTHFNVLRSTNFNRRKKSGLLIVQCKDYPFVVKLFMETPDMFVRPYRKGLYPMFFYFMGGGVNRHLSGFTRIKNAEKFRSIIDENSYWKTRVDIPRKWFLVPKDTRWITIAGTNIGKYKYASIDIPGTYCIIADAIDIERTMSLTNPDDRVESLALCNTAHFIIDPHIDNFMIERNTHKIVLVDTEHFPSMVGLKKDVGHYSSQTSWYLDLSHKAAQDIFFKNKQQQGILDT